MTDTDSAISILHQLRNNLDLKINWYKTTSWVMFGALVLDYIIFLFTDITLFQLVSYGIIFLWIVFSVMMIILINREKEDIDEFFLQTEILKNEQDKKKQKK